MSKVNSFLIEQVELVESEFGFMDIEELFDRVLEKISNIGLIEYRCMCLVDRFDYLVDEILVDLGISVIEYHLLVLENMVIEKLSIREKLLIA